MATAIIRPAQLEDVPGIAKVHVDSWIAAYSDLLPAEKMAQLDVTEREAAWRSRLTHADAEHLLAWVAVLDNEIVGFACTRPSVDDDVGPDVHELAALYLLSSVWRAGIGSRLLTMAETGLRDTGVRDATLWVLEGNEGAARFYEAHGWQIEKRDPCFKDFGRACLRYRKQL